VVYKQTAAPTKRPDGGTNLTTADKGRVWVDDNKHIFVYSGTTWQETGVVSYEEEHNWATGRHLEGSALAFVGVPGSTTPGGIALGALDIGRLCVNENDHLKYWNGSAWTSIMASFNAANVSLDLPGFIDIGELTLMWGKTAFAGNPGGYATTQTCVFPKLFPNACLTVLATCIVPNIATGATMVTTVRDFSTAGVNISIGRVSDTHSWPSHLNWLAIGW
jgi:hypothetical protein